jgi:tetratricopeptide (TPR) repeat protein
MLAAAPLQAQPVIKETPGAALARQVRVLASSPRDFNALIGAGHAALELGDVQAAAGFFGRAEEVNPNAPAAKAGLGAAMANMGDSDGAIFYFDQAVRLGAQPLTIALDRGLARDLRGDLGGAQADYRLAISSLNLDEARRRLALSLAIAGNRKGAIDAIQPLLDRRDAAAQRTRAFVLALVGDRTAAAQAIDAAMPGTAARFEPFFRTLPKLSVAEKAAAVHLGIFPENAEARVGPPTVAMAAASPPPEPVPAQRAPIKVASVTPPLRSSGPSPSFNLPSANRATPTVSKPAPTVTPPAQAEAEPLVEVPSSEPAAAATKPPAEPAFSIADLKPAEDEQRLSGIDKILATLAEAPPPPQPKVEKGPTKAEKAAVERKIAEKKAAADKRSAEKKAAVEKLAAEKKAKEEAARLGVKGTNWVQLAGGSNQDRMATEDRKLSAKAGKLLKSRPGYVTSGKDYFRLLVGPFDSREDSHDFVNKLAKEGVDSFSWTRTPAQIKIEKISTQ